MSLRPAAIILAAGDEGVLDVSTFLVLGFIATGSILLYRIVARRLPVSTSSDRCTQCGYDLRGLHNSRCPECGHPTAPDTVRL
jgi:lipopolysaccharide biosynthesis regulator YciM